MNFYAFVIFFNFYHFFLFKKDFFMLFFGAPSLGSTGRRAAGSGAAGSAAAGACASCRAGSGQAHAGSGGTGRRPDPPGPPSCAWRRSDRLRPGAPGAARGCSPAPAGQDSARCALRNSPPSPCPCAA